MATSIPVNLINGPLGAGKTSLIRQLLRQKPAGEVWALLINEFGALGIDAHLIAPDERLYIKQLAGGCICCTVKQDLEQALQRLIELRPDRLLVEPTGLSEPDSLADLFLNPALKPHYQLQTLVTIFDSADTCLHELRELNVMRNLVQVADIILLNKTDLATSTHLDALHQSISAIYPPKTAIHLTQQAWLDYASLCQPHQSTLRIGAQLNTKPALRLRQSAHHHPAAALDLPLTDGLLQRTHYQALDAQTYGWLFDSGQCFDWQGLQSLLQTLHSNQGVLRAKGLFRVGNSWMLFQWTPTQLTRELVSYRKDSRIELILRQSTTLDLAQFEQALLNTQLTQYNEQIE
ncbi:MAG: GTP-binding protein [Thiomicrospira sp.]